MTRRIGSKLQNRPRGEKQLNSHRLHLIRLAILWGFRDPARKIRESSVPFETYYNRVNGYLWLDFEQHYGITDDHLLFQLEWFCNRGLISIDVAKGTPTDIELYDLEFDEVLSVALNEEMVKAYYGEGTTPEQILEHLESNA